MSYLLEVIVTPVPLEVHVLIMLLEILTVRLGAVVGEWTVL